jgi:hypothetical protein
MNIDNTILSSIFCYKSKKFYILTLPKIASSWLYEVFLNNHNLRDIPKNKLKNKDDNSVGINQITLNTAFNPNEVSYDIIEFSKDWANLIDGSVIDSDVIFLMRDPIDKFITGIMQDFIFKEFKMNSPHILKILNTYPNKKELEQFFVFDKENTPQLNDEWWHNPGMYWPEYTYNVMYYIVSSILENWISDVDNIQDYRQSHSSLNLFLYYKILFNSNIKKDTIKIVDIDTENIYDYLVKNYNMPIHNDFNTKLNPTADVFKKIVKTSIKKYENILRVILMMDVLMYCDIHNYIYSSNITPDELWDTKLN